MPYLYCAAHGRAFEDRVIADQEEYRAAGESMLVVSGRLTTGPRRCDKCNAPLHKGDPAMLLFRLPPRGHAVDVRLRFRAGAKVLRDERRGCSCCLRCAVARRRRGRHGAEGKLMAEVMNRAARRAAGIGKAAANYKGH